MTPITCNAALKESASRRRSVSKGGKRMAVKKAMMLSVESSAITLSRKDQEAFAGALLSPGELPEGLKRAAARHAALIIRE